MSAVAARVAADLLLVLHFAFVIFVVSSLPLILVGGRMGWTWVRNRLFRQLHREVYALDGMACGSDINRFRRDSLADPNRWSPNWNRREKPLTAGSPLREGLSHEDAVERMRGWLVGPDGTRLAGWREASEGHFAAAGER